MAQQTTQMFIEAEIKVMCRIKSESALHHFSRSMYPSRSQKDGCMGGKIGRWMIDG